MQRQPKNKKQAMGVLTREAKAGRVGQLLDEFYPTPPVPLDHIDPFSLLIATLLSAQTTDKKVNQVTPALFQRAATPQAMARLSSNEIYDLIRAVGLAPTKARNIQQLSEQLVTRYNGEVPCSFEALESLPGVGHKTASVVMAHAFHVPAFPVDTHIHRLAARWGLSSGKNVKHTEEDLKQLFPRETWIRRHLQIIYFGREHCPARAHQYASCPICSWASLVG